MNDISKEKYDEFFNGLTPPKKGGDVLYCPICGNVLMRQEVGDTTIWFCDEQKTHGKQNEPGN